jgi:DNA-binding response OmpR family regulator
MPHSVIIAEDDPVLRNLYVKRFQEEQFLVRTAENGEEAMKLISELPPDLLICDVHMPKADGFHVLKMYPPTSRNFPIILLTNFDQDEFKMQAQELGADDYFVKKDMTIRKLLDMANRVIQETKK